MYVLIDSLFYTYCDGGLYYMRARYYDAQAGRFISEDPAGFVDGPNLYVYVGNNPLIFVDPLGLKAKAGFSTFAVKKILEYSTGEIAKAIVDMSPAGERIVAAGFKGAAAGALTGLLKPMPTPAGRAVSAAAFGFYGSATGMLTQTVLEAEGVQRRINTARHLINDRYQELFHRSRTED